jgi:hypothetical protein
MRPSKCAAILQLCPEGSKSPMSIFGVLLIPILFGLIALGACRRSCAFSLGGYWPSRVWYYRWASRFLVRPKCLLPISLWNYQAATYGRCGRVPLALSSGNGAT